MIYCGVMCFDGRIMCLMVGPCITPVSMVRSWVFDEGHRT